MAEEIEFVNGLLVKAPREGAPDFVKCAISIKVQDLTEWLAKREGEWVNLDVKESRDGKYYAAVNNWKPKEGDRPAASTKAQANKPEAFDESDLPF